MTSNSRKLASQVCAIFPYSCLHITYGLFSAYVVIIIAQLHGPKSEIPTTLDQLTWFAALEIIKPITTLFTGLLMHRWGCRPMAFIAALLFTAAGLMYYFSTTITIIFVGRLLSSLFSVTSIANPYISEISEPGIRSQLFMMAHLSGAIGSIFALMLDNLMYWRTIALVILIFPILAAVTVVATPHSPSWLASKGRLDEAEKSLCWLRGWVKAKQVQAELVTLLEPVQTSKAIPEKQTLDVEADTCQKRSKEFFKLFIQRSFYVPLGTMCLIFLLGSMNGISTIDTYSIVIFGMINCPIKDSVATTILALVALTGNFIILFLMHRVGKRNLIFFSVTVTGSCYAVVALVQYLQLEGQYLWISPIAIMIARFAHSVGIAAVVFILPTEIFPSSVRYVGSSISLSVKMVMESMMKKIFLYAVEAYTLTAVFAFFAFVNLISLIIFYFLFPETGGRSLGEVEKQYIAVTCKLQREMSIKNGYPNE